MRHGLKAHDVRCLRDLLDVRESLMATWPNFGEHTIASLRTSLLEPLFPGGHWPTFNVADAAIVIGIGLMLLQMLPQRGQSADKA